MYCICISPRNLQSNQIVGMGTCNPEKVYIPLIDLENDDIDVYLSKVGVTCYILYYAIYHIISYIISYNIYNTIIVYFIVFIVVIDFFVFYSNTTLGPTYTRDNFSHISPKRH